MRGDGLGVGHIGEVPGDAWGLGSMASGHDGRGAGRKRDAGMMTGLGVMEHDATAELSRDSVGVSDDTRADHGACGVHRSGSEGHTGCEAMRRESDTSVRCLVTLEAWGTRQVDMMAGERTRSVSQAWTVDFGILSVLRW